MGQAYILRGDARWLPLPDASVDLIVTSPPYFALRSYQDGDKHYAGQIGSEPTPQDFLEALWACTAEWIRVLKPSGSIWVNLGDKYSQRVTVRDSSHQPGMFAERANEFSTFGRSWVENRAAGRTRMPKDNLIEGAPIREKSLMALPWRYAIGCIDRLGLILRAEVIWSKPNGLPESVTDRVRRSHEQWFHFTKQGRYFSAVDEIRETHLKPANGAVFGGAKKGLHLNAEGHSTVGTNTYDTLNPLGKLPGSVWVIPSEPLLIPDWAKEKYALPDHFAAFPQEWPRRIILGWSPSGICTVCGEGRRPVTTHEYVPARARGGDGTISRVRPLKSELGDSTAERTGQGASFNKTVMDKDVKITGYACACPTPDAPTRPAVVVDPFGGTGTTAMVAKALGRTGISVDLSADYCMLARWRIEESRHGAKAEDRTWRDAQGRMF